MRILQSRRFAFAAGEGGLNLSRLEAFTAEAVGGAAVSVRRMQAADGRMRAGLHAKASRVHDTLAGVHGEHLGEEDAVVADGERLKQAALQRGGNAVHAGRAS